jgi:hypothetical protein
LISFVIDFLPMSKLSKKQSPTCQHPFGRDQMGLHCPISGRHHCHRFFSALQLWRAPMSKPGPDDTGIYKLSQVLL